MIVLVGLGLVVVGVTIGAIAAFVWLLKGMTGK